MKNQYFGDIGDYGKYGLLRFLAERGVYIAVNWYLTTDDGSADGRFTRYLEEEKYRRYDPALYDVLREYVICRKRRDVSIVQEEDLIPGATYWADLLPSAATPWAERRQRRREWHSRALAFCAGADLVFLDPDNGIRPEGKSSSPQNSKYAYLEEIVEYWKAGRNVVYYCHKGRRTDEQWSQYKGAVKELVPEAEMLGLTFHRGTQRSYLFVLQKDSAAPMKQLAGEFLASAWGDRKMFTEEPM